VKVVQLVDEAWIGLEITVDGDGAKENALHDLHDSWNSKAVRKYLCNIFALLFLSGN
jgi:hypothetical protein